MIELYKTKNKINEGGRNLAERRKDIGDNFYKASNFINNLSNSRYGVIKKSSSKIMPYSEIPSGYNKDELNRELLKFIINTPFDLSKMTYEEIIYTFLIKIFGTDVLVELVVDIKNKLISQKQFDLVFNNLIHKYNSLNRGVQTEIIKLIDTELKNKKRFKRTIWVDDYSEEKDYYIRFPNGLSEIINLLINSKFISEEGIEVLEEIKAYDLGLLTEKKDNRIVNPVKTKWKR